MGTRSTSSRRVTQKDVAQRAGVSTSIVSYVINDGPRSVSADTRARVLQAVEELDYRPNKYAQMLMRSQTESEPAVRQFGIVLGGDSSLFTHPYYGAILSGIYAEAHRLHIRIRFLQFLDDLADPLLFNELIQLEEISGILLFALDTGLHSQTRVEISHPRQEIAEKILKRIDNVVCLERQWRDLPAVVFDRSKAAYDGVDHLISLGHQRIGYVGTPDDRLNGYRNVLFDHGLAYDEALIAGRGGRNMPDEGHDQAAELMSLDSPPTAIFACSDEVAMGAIDGLHELGLRVPQDIALVSVDDIQLAAYCRPRLTTVHVPKAQMGAYGVRMLYENTAQPEAPAISAVLPTKLIIRESCGARLQADAKRGQQEPASSQILV